MLDIIVILGPTAVGKTELSIRLAEKFKGEIVSADSRLLYRGMDIGTAKPSQTDRERVPHHLIDVSPPSESWSVARFVHEAGGIIDQIQRRKNLPFLVGGSGQYITALLEGWSPPPQPKNRQLRAQFEKVGREQGRAILHQQLAQVDPVSAERIQATNQRRVIRALEIYHSTGIPASQQRNNKPPGYRILRIGLRLARKALYTRIDRRIDQMMANGFEDEVRALVNQGFDLELPAMSAIGYKQIGMAISGKISFEEAIKQIQKLTRQFVRRQDNWFKETDPEIHWFDVRGELVAATSVLIREFLEGEEEEDGITSIR
ncbi:MAG: tRNA (adenosine(37)-N6)-dimethylallyltransferase MiaA [Chloroflexi bacterium]|nr:tRNA (adenosine(37)-N6)-dimethylallyltransferase MiaA [Chloroflexota bacterium]